jgi:hypothetical protein
MPMYVVPRRRSPYKQNQFEFEHRRGSSPLPRRFLSALEDLELEHSRRGIKSILFDRSTRPARSTTSFEDDEQRGADDGVAGGVGDRPGGIVSLHRLLTEHGEAIEYELLTVGCTSTARHTAAVVA